VSRYSPAVLEALALAGAEWEAMQRGACPSLEHGRLAVTVRHDGEPEPEPPRCAGCGAERPVLLRVALETVPDRCAEDLESRC
jgi:hypothetical protein